MSSQCTVPSAPSSDDDSDDSDDESDDEDLDFNPNQFPSNGRDHSEGKNASRIRHICQKVEISRQGTTAHAKGTSWIKRGQRSPASDGERAKSSNKRRVAAGGFEFDDEIRMELQGREWREAALSLWEDEEEDEEEVGEEGKEKQGWYGVLTEALDSDVEGEEEEGQGIAAIDADGGEDVWDDMAGSQAGFYNSSSSGGSERGPPSDHVDDSPRHSEFSNSTCHGAAASPDHLTGSSSAEGGGDGNSAAATPIQGFKALPAYRPPLCQPVVSPSGLLILPAHQFTEQFSPLPTRPPGVAVMPHQPPPAHHSLARLSMRSLQHSESEDDGDCIMDDPAPMAAAAQLRSMAETAAGSRGVGPVQQLRIKVLRRNAMKCSLERHAAQQLPPLAVAAVPGAVQAVVGEDVEVQERLELDGDIAAEGLGELAGPLQVVPVAAAAAVIAPPAAGGPGAVLIPPPPPPPAQAAVPAPAAINWHALGIQPLQPPIILNHSIKLVEVSSMVPVTTADLYHVLHAVLPAAAGAAQPDLGSQAAALSGVNQLQLVVVEDGVVVEGRVDAEVVPARARDGGVPQKFR